MKVLVTGNLGYIGPVLVESLARAGHEVHGYDSALFVRHAMLPLPAVAHQTLADLRDATQLRRAVEPCEAVIHLAALSNDPLGELDVRLTRQVNLDATLALIDLAREKRVIFYSSASVYGATRRPCTEEAAVHPLTLYSELKLAAERAALGTAAALVMRNGTVHGPAPVLRGDLLLNAMVASAVALGSIVLTTVATTMRPVVDVRDLAELTVLLLDGPAVGVYNVAFTNISVGDAAALVARITGARLVNGEAGADARDYSMDTSRVRGLVGDGWRPRSLETSIADLVSHYREIGLPSQDVRSRRYHRIAQFLARAGAAAPAH